MYDFFAYLALAKTTKSAIFFVGTVDDCPKLEKVETPRIRFQV